MAKDHEHTAWARINRRLGPEIVETGERERPSYLGQVIELQGIRKHIPSRKNPRVDRRKRSNT